jgi:ABC-2 type transport system permease protein
VREGVRGRQFMVTTVLVLVILGGIVLVSALTGSNDRVTVGLGGREPHALVRALDDAAKPLRKKVTLHRYATSAAARDAVAHRKVDVAFVSGGRVLLERKDSDATALAVAGAAGRSAFLATQARQAGITPAQARAVLASPVAVARVEPAGGAGSDATALALASTIVLFIAVSMFGQSVLTSVVQEKAGRIVEVLLAAIRPRHLLAGKVAGVGLLGLSQIALIVVAAYAARAAGLISLPALGRTAPLVVACFLCGFTLYAVAFAGAGALVSRLEDATSAALPVSLTMLAAYLVSFGQLSSPDSTLANVLTLIPITAPFALPARAALTSIPAWEYVVSFAGMLAAIWVLIRVAGRVYELGLLRSGPRVPFREALQAARRATV